MVVLSIVSINCPQNLCKSWKSPCNLKITNFGSLAPILYCDSPAANSVSEIVSPWKCSYQFSTVRYKFNKYICSTCKLVKHYVVGFGPCRFCSTMTQMPAVLK